MPDRSYLSIGDVLNLLKEEFPDITISKIRFLESQGLLDPERTPSGYRKFYDTDVERLRWILRQQKENFLPLKVIKGRLEPGAPGAPPDADSPDPPPDGDGPGESEGPTGPNGATPPARVAAAPARTPPEPAPAPDTPPPGGAPPEPVVARQTAATAVPVATATPVLSAGATGVSLTFDELVEASGLDESAVRDLERFGLIVGRPVARTVYYDEESLVVGRLAAEFRRFGVEARHLRMYKTAAERESGFFEQIVTPLLKQRNPRARGEAMQTARDLSELGGRLRDSMLRLALRDITGG
jgi:DNA-binding transcriptional MerR regulator